MRGKIILILLTVFILGLWGILYAAEEWYDNYEATTPGCEYDRLLRKTMSAEEKAALESDKRFARNRAALSEVPTTPDALGGMFGDHACSIMGGGMGGGGGGGGQWGPNLPTSGGDMSPYMTMSPQGQSGGGATGGSPAMLETTTGDRGGDIGGASGQFQRDLPR